VDGEEVDPVVAPAVAAGELVDRHHRHGGHAQFDQVVEMVDGAGEGAFGAERTDVHLVEDGRLQVEAGEGFRFVPSTTRLGPWTPEG
jgi:hypothetical protein